ncbi:MAG: hypothetical protein ACYDDC_05060 [Thermoplasmataceae archaeon]
MIRFLGMLLLIDFIVTLTILITDNNLKNDFGIYKGSGYFYHWYGLMITGILDLIGAIILFIKPQKIFLMLGAIWSIIMIAFTVGDIFQYKSVGFSNASQFASYLFGLSKFPGAEPYYPGLFDILVGIYVIALIYSIIAVIKTRNA